jgi:hypothetical protein
MRNHFSSAVYVLLACSFASVMGFVSACTVGVLAGYHSTGSRLAEMLLQCLLFGAVPCSLFGLPMALACWALIPTVHRVLSWRPWWLNRRSPGGPAAPVTPHSVPAAVRPPGLMAGALTGMALSFFNLPAYLAHDAIGWPALGLAFLAAGSVAGMVLGWCRSTQPPAVAAPRWAMPPASFP